MPVSPNVVVPFLHALDYIHVDGNLVVDTNTLFVDATLNRVGIGTALPNNTFQVAGLFNSDTVLTSLFIGDRAGEVNAGLSNLGIGSQALMANVDGIYNLAVGANAMLSNVSGLFNVAIGGACLLSNVDGSGNVAIGTTTLQASISTFGDIGVGQGCLRALVTGDGNVTLGYQVMRDIVGANYNSCFGAFSMATASAGDENTCVGAFTLYRCSGSYNVAIGTYTFLHATAVSGTYNVGIGYSVGATLGSGARNILIGNQVDVPSASINDYLTIGDTIFGDLAAKSIRIGAATPTARLHLPAGTTAANTAPQKFTSGPLLTTAEAGAVEFLTDAFYGTITTGAARKTFAFLESPAFTGTVTLPTVTQTGLTTTYNNIATVKNGLASEVATIDSTGLTANVGASTLYAAPSSGEGLYRVSAYLVTTTAASVSSTMPNAQVVYTDKDANTSVTLDVSPVLGAAGLGQSGLLTANTVGTVFSGSTVIYVKASTTIQYQTVNYASTAAGMAYALHIRLEAI